MRDGRTFLKVKIKSLTDEAAIIRTEEGRTRCQEIWEELIRHRKWDVRNEARAAQLAYAFVRGRSYAQTESKCHQQPNWGRVKKLIQKYGLRRREFETSVDYEQRKSAELKVFETWRKQEEMQNDRENHDRSAGTQDQEQAS